MKVCDKSIMPDGTKIQLEDWKSDYSCFKTLSIGAYPKAKQSSDNYLIKINEPFRLEMNRNWKSDKEVIAAYQDLILGKKKLEDFKDKFWNLGKDQYYLGLKVKEAIA